VFSRGTSDAVAVCYSSPVPYGECTLGLARRAYELLLNQKSPQNKVHTVTRWLPAADVVRYLLTEVLSEARRLVPATSATIKLSAVAVKDCIGRG